MAGSEAFRRDFGNLFDFLGRLWREIPWKTPPIPGEIWDVDHSSAFIGMLNPNFIRARCDAMVELIRSSGADGVVGFWNPVACMVARVAGNRLQSGAQG